jgi:diguanylate cyclase (GGDEF)-like protein
VAVTDWSFTGRPLRLQVYIGLCVVAALVLPWVVLTSERSASARVWLLTAGALVALSAVNVEIGRRLEGGVKSSHRPHKALSAWALAAALLLPSVGMVLVVVATYAHARWRGLRLPLWKWVGSACFVILAALAASSTAGWMQGVQVGWMSPGARGLVAVVAAAGAFLVVEAVLFHGTAYLNDATDEVWLRRTLASPRFYATEAAVLAIGGMSASVWLASPWTLPLLLPAYALAQQAVLFDPLRQQATVDAKTGLYRYETWRAMAVAEHDRCTSKHQPWAVLFADLDLFKAYNDTWGHLAGDTALTAVAELFRTQLRCRDLIGRFGGEEFCVFLPDTTPQEAGGIAERLRAGVHSLSLPDTGARITISIGVAHVEADDSDVAFVDALTRADHGLYAAKDGGRDTVCMDSVTPNQPGPGCDLVA